MGTKFNKRSGLTDVTDKWGGNYSFRDCAACGRMVSWSEEFGPPAICPHCDKAFKMRPTE